MTWLGGAKTNVVYWVSEMWREKEGLIGVLSRTVFMEENRRKQKHTGVSWPVCTAAEQHTEIWGSKLHLPSRRTFSKIL